MKISFKNIFRFKSKNKEKGIEIKNKITGEKVVIRKVYDSSTSDTPVKKRAGATKNKFSSKLITNFSKNRRKLARGHYVLFFAMLVLSAISVHLTAKTYLRVNEEDYLTFEEDGKEVTEEVLETISKVEETEKNTVDNVDKIDNDKDNKQEIVEKKAEKKETLKPLSFSKPLSGEIIKVYSPDKVIYSKTLELWKTHDGLDIKGNIGDSVKSIERGIVEKIYDDSFYGKTIVIDHGQGYKSSYSNLDDNVYVKVNQSIIKGKVIGKISNTSIGEIKDEPHLHFMLFKDSNVIDPTSIFK